MSAYFGHHKCATNWVANVMEATCDALSLTHVRFNNWLVFERPEIPQSKLFARDFAAAARDLKVDFVSFTDAEPEYPGLPGIDRGFHVIRDPRDMVVSAYFNHLHGHTVENLPGLAEHRQQLLRVSKIDGLIEVIRFLKPVLDDLRNWNYGNGSVLEVRYEDMVADSKVSFSKIVDHLGWRSHELSMPALENALAANSFSCLSGGRGQGEEDLRSHYRRGVPGDWRNHFTPEVVRFFKECYNGLLVQLGYEQSLNWEL